MTTPAIPSPQTAVQALRHTLATLVNALIAGATHAQWYADTMDEDPDRALSPALVRKGAKRFLVSVGHDVDEEASEQQDQTVGFEAEYLPNLGLSITAVGYNIRILRSDRGLMPVPGASLRRQAFYAQQQSLFDLEPDAVDPVTNLVLHWSTDDEYNLCRVYLACPRGGTTTRASVEAYWDELVWRRVDPAIANGTQVEAQASDLDIYLDHEATGSGE
jgi:hypothetical protein